MPTQVSLTNGESLTIDDTTQNVRTKVDAAIKARGVLVDFQARDIGLISVNPENIVYVINTNS